MIQHSLKKDKLARTKTISFLQAKVQAVSSLMRIYLTMTTVVPGLLSKVSESSNIYKLDYSVPNISLSNISLLHWTGEGDDVPDRYARREKPIL